jgi:hypothetical protein
VLFRSRLFCHRHRCARTSINCRSTQEPLHYPQANFADWFSPPKATPLSWCERKIARTHRNEAGLLGRWRRMDLAIISNSKVWFLETFLTDSTNRRNIERKKWNDKTQENDDFMTFKNSTLFVRWSSPDSKTESYPFVFSTSRDRETHNIILRYVEKIGSDAVRTCTKQLMQSQQ